MKVPLIIVFVVFALLNIYNFFTQRTAIRIRRYCALTEDAQSILYPAYFNFNIIVSLVYVVLLICLAIWINWVIAIVVGIGLLLFCMIYPLPIHYFIQVFRKKLQKDLDNGKTQGRQDLLNNLNELEIKSKFESLRTFTESNKSADTYLKNGNAKFEVHDFNAAIEINPKSTDAYNNRGNIKAEIQDCLGAIADFNKAIEINPNNPISYYNRGTLKYQQQEFANAITDFNKAIEIDPYDAKSYHNRALSKDNLEDYNGAIDDYTKAIEINPQFPEAYNNRGNTKGAIHDYTGAIADFNQAIKINPEYADNYNRGLAKYSLQDLTGAISDFNKAIEINPNHAKAFCLRGLAKIDLGQKDNGCIDLSKAGELGYDRAYLMIKKYCK